MLKRFPLKEGVTTRQVNAAIRAATAQAIREMQTGNRLPHDVAPNEERRKARSGSRYYVFGMGTSLRDTLVAHYEPGTSRVEVAFPNGYTRWEDADFYTQARVRAYDLILHSGILDPHRRID